MTSGHARNRTVIEGAPRADSLRIVKQRVALTVGSLVTNEGPSTPVHVSRDLELDVIALASTHSGQDDLARLLGETSTSSIAHNVIEALSRGTLVYEPWTPAFGGGAPFKKDEVDLHDLAEDEPEVIVEHAVVLELVDGDDIPVARAAFELIDPDGRKYEGRLDDAGRAEVEGIRKPGDCKVCFPEFDQSSWDYVSAYPL